MLPRVFNTHGTCTKKSKIITDLFFGVDNPVQGVGGRASGWVRQPGLSRVEQVELLHLAVVAHRRVEAAAVAQERRRCLRYEILDVSSN